ncbi:MAG: YbaB/EbfC family nucleoid-associated protein [bacterium]|nr:YbaB/EbfC family nucleoid-associated protein [bacterium]
MLDKLKQLYELKKQADQMKKELEVEVLEVEVGDVVVKVNAAQKVLNLSYPENTHPDRVRDAINKAMDEAQKVAAKKMQGMMGGMGGMADLLKG